MAFLNVKFSGTVTKMLAARSEKWAPKNTLGAVLTVPESLAWWRYQEFGTAGKNEAGDQKGATYVIRSKGVSYNVNNESNPHQLIFWSQLLGSLINRGAVVHPGVRPAAFVRKVLPEIQDQMCKTVRDALRKGALDRPDDMVQAALHSVQLAKNDIVTSMAVHLGNYVDDDEHPEFGKLAGVKPEVVFEANATVEKIE
jgi:hypothetical protein